MDDPRYESFMGLGPKRIAHWEHCSNPDAETYLTGIDYYAHPRQCRLKLQELYPELGLSIPETDAPRPRPEQQDAHGMIRWGDTYRDHARFQHQRRTRFDSYEEMLRFSPLAQGDFTGWTAGVKGDFRSEEVIYARYRKHYPAKWGDHAPPGSSA